MSNNNWSRSDRIALLGLLIALIACLAAVVVVPEFRRLVGLDPALVSNLNSNSYNSNQIVVVPSTSLNTNSGNAEQLKLHPSPNINFAESKRPVNLLLPDQNYFQFGQIFKAELPQSFSQKNPHHVAQYAMSLCKEGETTKLRDTFMYVEEDKELGEAFLTYLREFGPDLEKFKGKPIYLKLEGYVEGKDTSVWYYYLVDSSGVNFPRRPWISLHRSKDSGNCALTGIFLNLPDEEFSDIPKGVKRSS